jgi:hypothetical protein
MNDQFSSLNSSTLRSPKVVIIGAGMTGRDSLHIDEAWKDKIEAYRSVLLKDYPNFFLMLGPHTPMANFSVIAMSEVQADYIMQLLDGWMQGDFDTVSPKQEAITRYQQFIRDGLSGSAWASGCQSWYMDADGDAIVWPYSWGAYVDAMAKPELDDLNLYKQPASV